MLILGAPWFKGGQGGIYTVVTAIHSKSFSKPFPKWHCSVNSFFLAATMCQTYTCIHEFHRLASPAKPFSECFFPLGIMACSLLIPSLFLATFSLCLPSFSFHVTYFIIGAKYRLRKGHESWIAPWISQTEHPHIISTRINKQHYQHLRFSPPSYCLWIVATVTSNTIN